jgi:amino acid transporter
MRSHFTTLDWLVLLAYLAATLGFTRSPFHAFLAIVLGTLAILFGGIAFSSIFSRQPHRS